MSREGGDFLVLVEESLHRPLDRDAAGFGRLRRRLRKWDLACPGACLFAFRGDCFGLVKMGLACLLAAEFSAERARDMDQACAAFPTTPALFEFACATFFGVSAPGFNTVATIESVPYDLTRLLISIARYCMLKSLCLYVIDDAMAERGGFEPPVAL